MTESTTTDVVLNDSIDLSCLTASRQAVLIFERDLAHFVEQHWTTTTESLDAVLPYAIATSRTQRNRAALIDLERVVGAACIADVVIVSETVYVRIAAAEQPALVEAEKWLRTAFPHARANEADSGPRVPISFWSWGTYANEVARSIAVPVWSDVSHNYPRAVRAGLDRLFDPAYRPADRGQLVLWHGDPGTGKTYALRALAWAWRDWCDIQYVTDPENFFGPNANYMIEVLLEEDDEHPQRWRVLVLEDTGALLAYDGGGGAGLSRLLNIVDGIVGQGLRVLVVVTTNEPLNCLHPAVSRPGRCAASVEFGPFEEREARDWLIRHGHDGGGELPSRPTLARLYAHLHGEDLPEAISGRPRVGFIS